MNILIIHTNQYYGQGLKDALSSHLPNDEITYDQFISQRNLTDFQVILADTESLRLICRSPENIFYDAIKIILIKKLLEDSHIPDCTYDSYIKENAAIKDIVREIDIVLHTKSVKTLRRRLRHDRLSSREYQVALCFLENKRNIDVAQILGIDEKTVSTYKSRLFRKLKIKSLLELKDAMRDINIV